MRFDKIRLLATSLLALTIGTASAEAQSGGYRRIATVGVPDKPLASVDFGYTDPILPFYYVADRSNAGVDIIDSRTNRFLIRITGNATFGEFSGAANLDVSGPNSIVPAEFGRLWVSNGDSTIKVVNLFALQVVNSVSTGGTSRVDGLAYDPKDHILIASNNADTPPFVTLISTVPGREQVLARITFDKALNGVEGLVYNPRNGLFYVSLPQIGDDQAHGGVAVIDPLTAKVLTTLPVDNCQGAGLALGPRRNLLLGCAVANNQAATPLSTKVIDDLTGAVLATVPQIKGSDQVWFDPSSSTYFLAARDNPGGSVLGAIDAQTNTFVSNTATGVGAHAVSADAVNNHVFVPLPPNPADPDCLQGCVGVYARSK